VVRLQTTIKFIRGICVDNVKCFLFAVGQDEGELVVFDINKPGRERETKEVAKLKNRSKSREICWSPSRGEIFVGNEDGSVTVWDARKTAPICTTPLYR
jgi:WD40 repeat protein